LADKAEHRGKKLKKAKGKHADVDASKKMDASKNKKMDAAKKKAAAKMAKHARDDDSPPILAPDPVGTYDDGTPFDQITYLEAKLILKPDFFTSGRSFRAFGRMVQDTARLTGVGFIPDARTELPPESREIVFGDTPDFRLYKNAFILRRRISYVEGFPAGDPEIVLKFRHPDIEAATKLDVRPKIAGKYTIKFKAEALPLKDRPGGVRILYSHNCQFGLSQTGDIDKASMATIGRVFPALTALKAPEDEHISIVNNGIVEEVLLPLGKLDFGKGVVAKCDVSLWRTRGEHKPLVGEFAFQAKFGKREDVSSTAKKIATDFYITLQRDLVGMLALGVTKTAMVYRLNGNPPEAHE